MFKASIVALGLLLGACTPQVVTKVQYVGPDVPTALLTCSPAPVVPDATKQSEVAQYIANLWAAHRDCYDKLGAVAQALSTAPAPSK